MKPKTFLAIDEVAEMLNFSVGFVRKLIDAGRLSPISNNSGEMLFAANDVQSLSVAIDTERKAASLKGVEMASKLGLYEDEFTNVSRKNIKNG